jgi:hypothetical protein
MATPPEVSEANRPARVRCQGCEFLWYGTIAAHGLSVIGSCPRCGGALEFRESAAPAGAPVGEAPGALDEVQPWRVLGVPSVG